uniref:Uncharacterized protein n=1 Tax=Lutzomyia longipalpis TaxID=7200 RepID=A0A1B0CMQ2_LUTLO
MRGVDEMMCGILDKVYTFSPIQLTISHAACPHAGGVGDDRMKNLQFLCTMCRSTVAWVFLARMPTAHPLPQPPATPWRPYGAFDYLLITHMYVMFQEKELFCPFEGILKERSKRLCELNERHFVGED